MVNKNMTGRRFEELKVHSSSKKDDVLNVDMMETLDSPCPHCGGSVWAQGKRACCQNCGRQANLEHV